MVAVDVAAEILKYVAGVLGLDADRARHLSGWHEVRIVW